MNVASIKQHDRLNDGAFYHYIYFLAVIVLTLFFCFTILVDFANIDNLIALPNEAENKSKGRRII